jgi:hypothetical protein
VRKRHANKDFPIQNKDAHLLIFSITTRDVEKAIRLKNQFAAAIQRMLRPVVRQLLAWGVSYPVFDRVVRGLFVAVAEEDFSLPHKRQTDSRVSLVTGIHRKEIARLRRQPSAERNAAPLEDAVVTRVIGRWMAGPPFADRAGRARPIAYEARRPSAPRRPPARRARWTGGIRPSLTRPPPERLRPRCWQRPGGGS